MPHDNQDQTCGTCKYWGRNERFDDPLHPEHKHGACHRYPPMPVTLSVMWCGEWQHGTRLHTP